MKDRTVRLCACFCLCGFLGFVAWAGWVPLAKGVVAHGYVMVEDQRRLVQHLEGGIVQAIHVREGSLVRAGETLLSLTNAGGEAELADAQNQADALHIGIARRTQQLAGATSFVADDELSGKLSGSDGVPEMLSEQTLLFNQQLRALTAEVKLLLVREEATLDESKSLVLQLEATRRAHTALQSQLASKRHLLSKQLARREEVARLEQDSAAADAELQRIRAEIDRALALRNDYVAQRESLESQYRERLTAELVEAREGLRSILERRHAIDDLVKRSDIVAPQAGKVINLRVNTIGGVVKPGQVLMEIVPSDVGVLAKLKVRPVDRGAVAQGLAVRTQILALRERSRQWPGTVVEISADLKVDQEGTQPYYEVLVALDADERLDSGLLPGYPVQAFVYSGFEETLMETLLNPLRDSIYSGLYRR